VNITEIGKQRKDVAGTENSDENKVKKLPAIVDYGKSQERRVNITEIGKQRKDVAGTENSDANKERKLPAIVDYGKSQERIVNITEVGKQRKDVAGTEDSDENKERKLPNIVDDGKSQERRDNCGGNADEPRQLRSALRMIPTLYGEEDDYFSSEELQPGAVYVPSGITPSSIEDDSVPSQEVPARFSLSFRTLSLIEAVLVVEPENDVENPSEQLDHASLLEATPLKLLHKRSVCTIFIVVIVVVAITSIAWAVATRD
jgi:hypothetical protein